MKEQSEPMHAPTNGNPRQLQNNKVSEMNSIPKTEEFDIQLKQLGKDLEGLTNKQREYVVRKFNKRFNKIDRCKEVSKQKQPYLIQFIMEKVEKSPSFLETINALIIESKEDKKGQQTAQIQDIIKSINELKEMIEDNNKNLIEQVNIKLKNIEEKMNTIANETKMIDNIDHLPVTIQQLNKRLNQLKDLDFNGIEQLLSYLRMDISSGFKIRDAILLVSALQTLGLQGLSPINIDLFYLKLNEGVRELSGNQLTSTIPDIRNKLESTLGLSQNQIDRLIIACQKKGWITLEMGSPIGETDPKHLIYEGTRYYYLRLIKKI